MKERSFCVTCLVLCPSEGWEEEREVVVDLPICLDEFQKRVFDAPGLREDAKRVKLFIEVHGVEPVEFVEV